MGTTPFRCTASASGGCSTWQALAACPTGLTCTASAKNGCSCPTTGTTVYVDSVDGSDSSSLYAPSGAQSPALCRYRSLDDGMAVARANDTVQLTTDVPAFLQGQQILAGQRVRPSAAKSNGYIYKPSANVTPATEPPWPTNSGANFTSDGVTWTQVGTTIFNQTATVVVPANVRVTNDLCGASSSTCGVGPYAIATNSQLTQVVTLGAGASLRGVVVAHLNVPNAGANGVGCSSGHVSLEQVVILGSAGILLSGSGNGLSVTAGCSFDAVGLTVSQWQNGLLLNSTSSTRSTLSTALLGKPDTTNGLTSPFGNSRGIEAIAGLLHLDTVFLPDNQIGLRLFNTANTLSTANVNGTGVLADGNAFAGMVMSGGTVNLSASEFNANGFYGAPNAGVSFTAGDLALTGTQVASNNKPGVVAKASTASTLKLDTVRMTGNGGAGLTVNQDSAAIGGFSSINLKVIDSEVSGNATDNGLVAASKAGVILWLPVTVQDFSGTHVHNNKGDQIRVNTGTVAGSLSIQGSSCDAQVYCYDSGGVGVSQTGTLGTVQVKDITFAHTHLSSGVDTSGTVSQSGGTCTTPSTLVCP